MTELHTVAAIRPRNAVRHSLLGAAALGAVLLGLPAQAAPAPASQEASAKDFTELSLQELLDVQVISISKHAEPLRRAAGAIYVITGEELRRSGARNLAEALRTVPGVQVARTNAQTYTVTARGLGADKLEVLLDGRSVYTPLTSTVFWDVLDTFLPDVERIEVIRGPGATLWGANAVNGVINIVTKSAVDTQGTMVRAGGGKEQKADGGFRSGSLISDTAFGRLYAKGFERDSSKQSDGSDTFDGQRHAQAGFRTDWTPAKDHNVTVLGDYYHGTETGKSLSSNSRAEDTTLHGGNLVARWSHELSKTSEVSAQAYYDGYRRFVPDTFQDERDTGDVQLQHRFDWTGIGGVTYGAGYKVSSDDTGGPPNAIIFDPAKRTLQTYSAFGQLQHGFGEDLELTVGSKFEHNSSTGFEVQPGVRVGWAFSEHWFTWGSVSRAVRLPNRLDNDIAIFCSPALASLIGCTAGTTVRIGNADFKSETVLAYEWGLRFWTDRNLALDVATFYNHYDKLKSTESSPPPFGSFANKMEGDTFGAELAAAWSPLEGLTLRPFYSYLEIDITPDKGSTDTLTEKNLEGGTPRNIGGLQIAFEPLSKVTVDTTVRYIEGLKRQQVPKYTQVNLRVAWRPTPTLELALVGQDLADPRHAEAGTNPSNSNPNPPPPTTEIERAIWLDLAWEWQ